MRSLSFYLVMTTLLYSAGERGCKCPESAGQQTRRAGRVGALEERRRGKAADEGMDREQGHNGGHLLGLQGDLLKVGCSSANEPQGGPGLPRNLSRRRKARAGPETLKVVWDG